MFLHILFPIFKYTLAKFSQSCNVSILILLPSSISSNMLHSAYLLPISLSFVFRVLTSQKNSSTFH